MGADSSSILSIPKKGRSISLNAGGEEIAYLLSEVRGDWQLAELLEAAALDEFFKQFFFGR